MREIVTGSKHTQVICYDKPGQGGACHTYCIERIIPNMPNADVLLSEIDFQKGPIKENGVNGCQNEDLIAVVIDRLQGFQSGEFSCRENAIALTKLEEALLWLRKRTMDREARGVEGTNIL